MCIMIHVVRGESFFGFDSKVKSSLICSTVPGTALAVAACVEQLLQYHMYHTMPHDTAVLDETTRFLQICQSCVEYQEVFVDVCC